MIVSYHHMELSSEDFNYLVSQRFSHWDIKFDFHENVWMKYIANGAWFFHLLNRVLFCLFFSRGNKQNHFREYINRSSLQYIYHFEGHNDPINNDQINNRHTLSPCITRFLCVLIMTSRSIVQCIIKPGNCYTGGWIVISISFDIDLILLIVTLMDGRPSVLKVMFSLKGDIFHRDKKIICIFVVLLICIQERHIWIICIQNVSSKYI